LPPQLATQAPLSHLLLPESEQLEVQPLQRAPSLRKLTQPTTAHDDSPGAQALVHVALWQF
jgi:hypothetical protein